MFRAQTTFQPLYPTPSACPEAPARNLSPASPPNKATPQTPLDTHQGSPICEGTVRTFSDASPTPCRPPCLGSLCQPHPRRFPSSIFSLSLQAPLFRFFSLPSVATGKSLKQTENTPELRSARPLPLCLPRDFLEPASPKELGGWLSKGRPFSAPVSSAPLNLSSCLWLSPTFISTRPQAPVFSLLPFPLQTSVAQSCPTLCDPMDCRTPGLPVHHQLPELTQAHVH